MTMNTISVYYSKNVITNLCHIKRHCLLYTYFQFNKHEYADNMAKYKKIILKDENSVSGFGWYQRDTAHILNTLVAEAIRQLYNFDVKNLVAGMLSFRLSFSRSKKICKARQAGSAGIKSFGRSESEWNKKTELRS